MRTAEEKLNAIAEIVAGEPLKAYEMPELAVDQVVVDGKTINRDGSKWTKLPGGEVIREFYGYISQKKNPELWARMREVLGEEAFGRWLESHDPWSLHRADPRAYAFQPDANAITLSQLLNTAARWVQED